MSRQSWSRSIAITVASSSAKTSAETRRSSSSDSSPTHPPGPTGTIGREVSGSRTLSVPCNTRYITSFSSPAASRHSPGDSSLVSHPLTMALTSGSGAPAKSDDVKGSAAVRSVESDTMPLVYRHSNGVAGEIRWNRPRPPAPPSDHEASRDRTTRAIRSGGLRSDRASTP